MLISEFRAYTKTMGCHVGLNFSFPSSEDSLDKYSFTRFSGLFGYDKEVLLRLFFNFAQEEGYKVESINSVVPYTFTVLALSEGKELLRMAMYNEEIRFEICQSHINELISFKINSYNLRGECQISIEELSSFVLFFQDIINENKVTEPVKKVLVEINTLLNCKIEEAKLNRSDAWKSDQELIEIKDFFDKLARVVEYSNKVSGLDLKQFLEKGDFNSQDPVSQGFGDVFKTFTSRIQDKSDGLDHEPQTWINREKRRREIIESTFPSLQ